MSSLFIEKYKPHKLNEIIGNSNIIQNIQKSVSMNILSNSLFYGESGTGKTTLTRCIVNEVLPDINIQQENLLEFNASEERNQLNIKKKLTHFVSKKILNTLPKIIIIDEIDNMLETTQSVISNFMDQDNILFLLTCNKLKSILESIQTRSLIYHFKLISETEIKKCLINICKKENILYDDNGLDALVFSANGDIRVAINNLNVTYNGYKYINNTNVFKICNIPEPQLLIILIDNIIQSDIHKAIIITKKFFKMGYNQIDIVTNLFTIVNDYQMSEELKLKFLSNINKTLFNLSSIINSELQLYDLYAQLIED